MVGMSRWLRGKQNSLQWLSASVTDVGRVRQLNEDSILDLPKRGIWAVADGMGGHAAGDVASGEIVSALAQLNAPDNLNACSGQVAGAILHVNDRLRSIANERGASTVIGSTVVAACARGSRMAILWAGDSRAYRFRNNRLEQLTRDHDLASDMAARNASEELMNAIVNSNVVSRAVGAHDELQIDEIRVAVEPGDAYLLCSDGLYKEVGDDGMSGALRETDPGRACARLMDAALLAGGRDNVSAIVIQARPG